MLACQPLGAPEFSCPRVNRYVYTERGGGSSPSPPTTTPGSGRYPGMSCKAEAAVSRRRLPDVRISRNRPDRSAFDRVPFGNDGDLVLLVRWLQGQLSRCGGPVQSCTGGLLASLITDLEGLSSSFECGFVSYSEESKRSLLNVPGRLITMHGAVSREVALAMANGALAQSHADLAVAITGFAGPAGKRDEEGLVHIAVIAKGAPLITRECHFGAAGRDVVRRRAVRAALEMLDEAIASEAA